MNKPLRIGTRDSALAIWQANRLQDLLSNLGIATSLVPTKSLGDLNLKDPLYAMGTVGIFTKTLDQALLNGHIDVAIHSMKDVPTRLPEGIKKAAVLERGVSHDVVVWRNKSSASKSERVIATGSLRRKAQWKNKWPKDHCEPLRGNIHTRLQKLNENQWDGAIFAAAALERLAVSQTYIDPLNEFIPAPAQGALLVVAREEDQEVLDLLSHLNHHATDISTQIERDFLQTLEGGCTAPIAAKAEIKGDLIHFKGALYSLKGKPPVMIDKTIPKNEVNGCELAKQLLEAGGARLMQEFKDTNG